MLIIYRLIVVSSMKLAAYIIQFDFDMIWTHSSGFLHLPMKSQ